MSAIGRWLSAHRADRQVATSATSATKRNSERRAKGLDVASSSRPARDNSAGSTMSQLRRREGSPEIKQKDQYLPTNVADVADVAGLLCCLCGDSLRQPLTNSWGGKPCHAGCGERAFEEAREYGEYG